VGRIAAGGDTSRRRAGARSYPLVVATSTTALLSRGLGLDERAQADFDRIVEAYFGRRPGLAEDKLHHYTNAAGLIGLLDTGKLWASLATHLNDSAEIVFGQRLIRERLEEAAEDHGEVRALIGQLGLAERPLWSDIYIVSFSAAGDLLSHWRAYADSRGYMLTFDVDRLPAEIPLTHVSYQQRDVGRFEETLSALARFYDQHLRDRMSDPAIRGAAEQALRRGLAMAAAALKPPSFAEEKEWRHIVFCENCDVSQPCETLRFRERAGGIVPYHEVDLRGRGRRPGDFPLSGITIGPGLDPALESRALGLMLRQKRLSHVTVTPTSVTFRPR
jgi:hypothetical protein